jgi:predicted component of type VI protein secretion system
MIVSLVLKKKNGQQKTFPLKGLTIIGRRSDCDLKIPLEEVSRRHCQVNISGETVSIRDLGSSNGTFVNAHKLEEQQDLRPGDQIGIGPLSFAIEFEGAEAKKQDAPAAPSQAAAADLSGEETAFELEVPQKAEEKKEPPKPAKAAQVQEPQEITNDETSFDLNMDDEKATEESGKKEDEDFAFNAASDNLPSLSDSELFGGPDGEMPSASGTQILKEMLGDDEPKNS